MNLEQEVFEIGKQLEKIVGEKGTAVSHIHLLLFLYELNAQWMQTEVAMTYPEA